MIHFFDWLLPRDEGSPSSLPVYLALALSLTAIAGQAMAYPHPDTTVEFGNGLTLVVALNLLAGLVLSLLFNPLIAFSDTATEDDADGYQRILAVIGISTGVQVVGGFLFSGAGGPNGDWSALWLPFAVGGLALGLLLLGWLAGMLVLWPVITLVRTLWRRVTGRAVNPLVTAGAILFLTISGLAVAAAFGTDAEVRGRFGPRGGIGAIIRLWTDQTGDPTTLAFRWVARCLMVILVLVFVWVAAVGRRVSRKD